MRRFVFSAALFASTVSLSPVAFAQDAPVPSATVTVTTPPPPPPPPPPVVAKEDEQEPLRLGRFLELESERAARQRYGGAATTIIGGAINAGIGIGLFVWVNNNSASFGSDSGLVSLFAALPIVIGGIEILGGVIDLFTTTPMERLFMAYAPIAIRADLTAAQRLERGETMLFAASEADHSRRVVGAVSSFVLAAVMAGLAIAVGADTNDFPSPDNAIFAASFAGISGITILQGVGALWWERGPAEIAWEQWHSMHEHVVVHTESKLHFAPMFSPIRGGATGGLSLVW